MTVRSHSNQSPMCAILAFAALFSPFEALAEPSGPDPRLMQIYERCSASAEIRVLSSDEATQCGQAYHAIKVSFLTREEIHALQTAEPAERAAILAKAYDAMREWRAARAFAASGM